MFSSEATAPPCPGGKAVSWLGRRPYEGGAAAAGAGGEGGGRTASGARAAGTGGLRQGGGGALWQVLPPHRLGSVSTRGFDGARAHPSSGGLL